MRVASDKSQDHIHWHGLAISDYYRRSRGKACEEVRTEISRLLSKHIDFSKTENWNWLNTHDAKTCKCSRGDIGRKKIREANEKRRAFYKTAGGLAVQKAYKQRARQGDTNYQPIGRINTIKKG